MPFPPGNMARPIGCVMGGVTLTPVLVHAPTVKAAPSEKISRLSESKKHLQYQRVFHSIYSSDETPIHRLVMFPNFVYDVKSKTEPSAQTKAKAAIKGRRNAYRSPSSPCGCTLCSAFGFDGECRGVPHSRNYHYCRTRRRRRHRYHFTS